MPDRDFFPEVPLGGFKQVERRKKAGQFALLARGPIFPVLRRWRPDDWTERADTWLWHHPKVHSLAAAILFAGIGFVLALFAFWRPWEE